MPFNPDDYVNQPQTTQQPEQFDPDKFLASPEVQAQPQQDQSNLGNAFIGVPATALHYASEYGKPALELGGAAIGAKKAFDAINALLIWRLLVSRGVGWAWSWACSCCWLCASACSGAARPCPPPSATTRAPPCPARMNRWA